MSSGDIDRHVRHVVGIATLRRLRRMVDSENAGEARQAIWARRLGILFAVVAAVFVAALAFTLHTH